MAIFGRKKDPENTSDQMDGGATDVLYGRRTVPTDSSGAQLVMPHEQRKITDTDLTKAMQTLQSYKGDKANLEDRIVKDELWYELRHWEVLRHQKDPTGPEPASAWLFNAIMNKHADAMDNYPEPLVLPREDADEEDAKTLSSILPVVLERCDFEQTYSDNWWEKLKHGSPVYSVVWNNELENGLGDIDIQQIDLLNIYWEPGISDIQQSRNVFTVELIDTDILDNQYPQFAGKMGHGAIDITKYLTADNIPTDNKSLVVNWYYKVKSATGRTLVHYVKFCGNCILFSSENYETEDGDGATIYPYEERGYYDHGLYPFVFDVLYPEKGSPAGFGYVAITRSPQMYIDKMDANIMENALTVTKNRFFVSESTDINMEEFMDMNKPIVHVQGNVTDDRIKQIIAKPMDSIYATVQQNKINELKETSANRDVSSGGTTSGVTAASAIAALQEAGNKGSRDMISASYRTYKKINYMVIELIRQFYDESRTFRITGEKPGTYQFVDYSNQNIRDQSAGTDTQGNELFRRPVFDIRIIAQKRNPISTIAQNEQAKELYQLGVFSPDRAQEASMMLSMMQFEGIDKIREQVAQGQTLQNVCDQLMQQLDVAMAAITGQSPDAAGTTAGKKESGSTGGGTTGNGHTTAGDAQTAQEQAGMTAMGKLMAANSTPDMAKQANNVGVPQK